MRLSYVITFLGCVSAMAGGGSQLEIKKFRFNKHESLHFDRLVVEFGGKGADHVPQIKVLPKGKETTVMVEKASLVGAIPESNINDSYSKKSVYLGGVSFNTDLPEGFSMRVFTKDGTSKVEAFFAEHPLRLIVDTYPAHSERAQGPQVLDAHRAVASHGGPHGAKSAAAKKLENVYCFNSSSQVKAALGYESGDRFKGIPMTVDGNPGQGANTVDNIVCYPKSAQVVPKVTFGNGEAPFREAAAAPEYPQAEVKPVVPEKKSLLPPSSGWVPPTSPKLPATSGWVPPTVPGKKGDREAQLNKEADSIMGDEDRKTASSDNSWEDNFNKNNPPPTLGKSLLPPTSGWAPPTNSGAGGAGARMKPQLASPASLLPPLK